LLQIGDKLKANWSENITDHVTKGKVYTVKKVNQVGFYIINDKGEESFPISTKFTKIN
jgi:uncharacterized protein YgiM (DUF1202 family)